MIRLSSVGGGMLPGRLYYYEGQFPAFTLFGDGTVVYASKGGLYQVHLDEAAIQQLLTLAVNKVRFFELGDFVGPTCCDMPGSQITLSADGKSKSVGMSLLDAQTPNDSPERRLQLLLDALDTLRTGHDPVYTPAGATVYADVVADQPSTAPPPWPLATVSLAAAVKDTSGLHLTGTDAQAVLQAAPRVGPFVEKGINYLVIAVPDAP